MTNNLLTTLTTLPFEGEHITECYLHKSSKMRTDLREVSEPSGH